MQAALGADIAALEAAVARLGYRASRVRPEAGVTVAERYDTETRYQGRTFAAAAVLTLPLFLISMLGDMDNTTLRALTWALATPVEFVFGW